MNTLDTEELARKFNENFILTGRGQKVLLDADLAAIYGVPTKVPNQAVKRNIERFPEDFRFQLTGDEAEAARRSRSQSVTLNRGQNIKYLPHAFTKHDDALSLLWKKLQPLLDPPPDPPRKEIGFHIKEAPTRYRTKARKGVGR